MPAGKTTFVLEADEAKAVNAFLKVIDAQGKTFEGMRKINREGDNFGKVASNIAQIAGGFGLATTASGAFHQILRLISKELDDIRRKENEAAKATTDYAKSFSQAMGQWLGAGNIDKAFEAVSKLTRETPIGYTKALSIMTAYAENRPKAGMGRGLEIVKMAEPLVYGEEETAALVAQLEKIMPEKSTEDLFDIAVRLTKRAGKHREELPESMKAIHRMTAAGIPAEKALGVLMAAFEEEQAGRAVQAMAKLPITLREKKIGKGMTDEELFDWAMAHPEKVEKAMGTGWAMIAPIMRPGAAAGWTADIQKAQLEDEYKKEITARAQSAMVSLTHLQERQQAGLEQLKMTYKQGNIIGFTRQATGEMLAAMPQLSKFERDLVMKAIGFKGRLGGEYATSAIESLGTLKRRFGEPTEKEYDVFPGEFAFPYETGKRITNVEYAPELAEAIGRLIERIREAEAAFGEIARLQQKGAGIEKIMEEKNIFQQFQMMNSYLKLIAESAPLRMIGLNNAGMVD